MMLGIAAGAAVLAAAFAAFVKSRPGTFRLERRTRIDAPVDKVYPLIADFRRWPEWSPWEKKDPGMKRTYSGAASGKGAVYAWEGNKDIGRGRMEIREASTSRIDIQLDFFAPWEAHNTAEFLMQGDGKSTTVSWAMTGPLNFAMKMFHLFIDMDNMVGKDFEAGLASMKAAAEKQPQPR